MTLRGDLKAIKELAPHIYEQVGWKLPAQDPATIKVWADQFRALHEELERTTGPQPEQHEEP